MPLTYTPLMRPKRMLLKLAEEFGEEYSYSRDMYEDVKELGDDAFEEAFDTICAETFAEFNVKLYMRYLQYYAAYMESKITEAQYLAYCDELYFGPIADIAKDMTKRQLQFPLKMNLTLGTVEEVPSCL